MWNHALEAFSEKTKGLKRLSSATVPVMQLPTDFPRPTGKEAEQFNVSSQSATVSLKHSGKGLTFYSLMTLMHRLPHYSFS